MKKLICFVLAVCSASLASETLTLTAADGTKVHAVYHPATQPLRGAVVLFHQLRGNTCEYGDFPEVLAAEGYAALTVDLRIGGNGFGCQNLTQSPVLADIYDVPLDIEAAVEWLMNTTKLPKVVLSGSSFSGGQVLLYAGAHPERIQGVLSYSPAIDQDQVLDLINTLKKLEVPVHFIAPESEQSFPNQLMGLLPTDRKTFTLPAGNNHGAYGLRQPDTAPQYREITLNWLNALVGQP